MIDMTTEIPRKAQTGEPTTNGGHFAKTKRTDDIAVNLWDVASKAPLPTEDQRDRAQVEASRRAVAGHLGGAEAADLADHLANRLAEQEAAYEAYKRGEVHQDDPAFDAIWRGDAPGINEGEARALLAQTIAQREAFDRGDLDPSDIIPGYRRDPRRAAEEHLDEKETLYSVSLDCGGKNLSINQSVVFRQRRAAEAAVLGVPF